ncbi:hypothetical protein IWQ62_002968, partial [Dispira parvispora]
MPKHHPNHGKEAEGQPQGSESPSTVLPVPPKVLSTPQDTTMAPNVGGKRVYHLDLPQPQNYVPEYAADFVEEFEHYCSTLQYGERIKVRAVVRFLPNELQDLVRHLAAYREGRWEPIKEILLGSDQSSARTAKFERAKQLRKLAAAGVGSGGLRQFVRLFRQMAQGVTSISEDDMIELALHAVPEEYSVLIPRYVPTSHQESLQDTLDGLELLAEEVTESVFLNRFRGTYPGPSAPASPSRGAVGSVVSAATVTNEPNHASGQSELSKVVQALEKCLNRLDALEEKVDSKKKSPACFYCGKAGHYPRECTLREQDVQNGLIAIQNGRVTFPDGSQIKGKIGEGGLRKLIQDSTPKFSSNAVLVAKYTPDQYEVVPEAASLAAAQKRRGNPSNMEEDTPDQNLGENSNILPKFRVVSKVENRNNLEVVEDHLEKATINVPLLDYLATAPLARKAMKSLVDRHRVPINSDGNPVPRTSAAGLPAITHSCELRDACEDVTEAEVSIHGVKIKILIDPGSQVNLISCPEAQKLFKDAILPTTRPEEVGGIGDNAVGVVGIAWSIPVLCGNVLSSVPFVVTKVNRQATIL